MFPGNLSFPPYIAVWFCFSQDLFGGLRDPLPGNLKTQTLDRQRAGAPLVTLGDVRVLAGGLRAFLTVK